MAGRNARNRWTDCSGIGGRFAPESLDGLVRNQWTDWAGIHTSPRPAFYRYLRGIVDAGFEDRVMFGIDSMVWPGTIEHAIAVIEEASFLSVEQKRDILYNNAARFLRLSKEEIARHHGR
jgi:hypothetical protein